jgi:hypothetical protein
MKRYDDDNRRKTRKKKGSRAAKTVTLLMVFVCCVTIPILIIGLMALPNASYRQISRSFYKLSHRTNLVSGFTVRDKSGEYYEHTIELLFTREKGSTDDMDFSFLWDVVDGFDERAVTFDDPGATYEIGPAGPGLRRLTVHCKDLGKDQRLTAKFIYPAETLAVRKTPPGYYRWDLDAYTMEDIPELDRKMATLKSPLACASWIKQHISYQSVSEDPQTAAETFYSGKGDCDDLAILFCYMVKRLFPETTPRIVEGWTTEGRYHANALIHTDAGWLMLDPSVSSVEFGILDFGPFVPSSRISAPFNITDAKGHAVAPGGINAAFGKGTVIKK